MKTNKRIQLDPAKLLGVKKATTDISGGKITLAQAMVGNAKVGNAKVPPSAPLVY